MIARATALLALVLLLGACASVEPARAPAATSGLGPPAPTREVLGNGVVLITLEHRASEVVALQLWMRVGGRDESADELGLSHYLEHMLFKGTPTRPPGSIDRLIEGLGGRSNPFTSYDYTYYAAPENATHAEEALGKQIERIRSEPVGADDLGRAKG